MKVLCIVALFVAVAAAQSGDDGTMMTEKPDEGRWTEDTENPAQSGDDGTMMTENPDEGKWPQDSAKPSRAPWISEKPGRGHPNGPHRGTAERRPANARPRHFEGRPDDAEVSYRPEALRRGGSKHRGPPGGRGPGRNPSPKNHTVLSPIFKVDNVIFQNSTTVQLKEGENLFFMQAKRPCKQYLKLTYNTAEPNQVSMEYGELKPPSRVFWPVFKVDNVTFQNTTGVQLNEGDNLFLKVKGRPHFNHTRAHPFKAPLSHRGPHGPPVGAQYLKVLYNSTAPNQVSIEYGVVKPLSLGAFTDPVDEVDDFDDEDF